MAVGGGVKEENVVSESIRSLGVASGRVFERIHEFYFLPNRKKRFVDRSLRTPLSKRIKLTSYRFFFFFSFLSFSLPETICYRRRS